MSVIPEPIAEIGRHFLLAGEVTHASPYGSGHINATFDVTTQDSSGPGGRYIFQRINHHIFRDVPALMENVTRVCDHLARKRTGETPGSTLNIVRTRDGASHLRHTDGTFWRVYEFIEDAETHDLITDPAQAYEAARAFGEFQAQLTDLPGPRLHETIPDFHNTRKRFLDLIRAVEADKVRRAAQAAPEIEFARGHESLVDVLADLQTRGALPERITHNDTKINNVMLDRRTGRAVCVIDLDTVMPGLSLHDFGDMARSATNSAAEDEPDASKVHVQLPVFEALVQGYLEYAGAFLNETEFAHLVASARLITFEIGLRFLTDFLQGDTYFKTTRPDHNLHRCRTQFALVRSMEEHATEMEAIVAKVTGR